MRALSTARGFSAKPTAVRDVAPASASPKPDNRLSVRRRLMLASAGRRRVRLVK